MGESHFAFLLRQLGRGIGLADDDPLGHPFHYVCSRNLDLMKPTDRLGLVNMLKELEPAFVLLDTLRDLHTGNENDSEVIKGTLDFALQLRDETKGVIAVIDHLIKPSKDKNNSRSGPDGYLLRGSGSKYARADSVLIARDVGGATAVSGTHRYGKPLEPFCFRLLTEEETRWGFRLEVCEAPAAAPGKGPAKSPEEKILAWLRAHPGGWFRTQIQEGAHVRRGDVPEALVNLQGRQLITRDDTGTYPRWALAEKPGGDPGGEP
jgi:hypothetical protein